MLALRSVHILEVISNVLGQVPSQNRSSNISIKYEVLASQNRSSNTSIKYEVLASQNGSLNLKCGYLLWMSGEGGEWVNWTCTGLENIMVSHTTLIHRPKDRISRDTLCHYTNLWYLERVSCRVEPTPLLQFIVATQSKIASHQKGKYICDLSGRGRGRCHLSRVIIYQATW